MSKSKKLGSSGSAVGSSDGSWYACSRFPSALGASARAGRAHLQVRVLERVVDLDSPLRAERQALLHQIDRLPAAVSARSTVSPSGGAHQGVRRREERAERLLLPERQRADVLARPLRRDRVKVVQRRRAEDVQDDRQLVVVCGPLRRRPSTASERASEATYSLCRGRAACCSASPRARTRRSRCRS